MYVVANQDSFKTRRPKLRASCGNCFLAKVKCSKARPICSRCLVSGADCNYTPSSQASKPKSDGSKASQSSISRDMLIPEDSNTLTTASTSQSMDIDGEHSMSYGLGTDWSTTPGSLDGWMNRRSVSSTLMPMIGDDSASEVKSSGAHPDLFDLYFSWTNTPRTDTTSPHIDNILLPRSKSLSDTLVPPSLSPWSDRRDNTNFSSSVPGLGPAPNLSMSNSMAKSSTCSCFNTSLQVLQALHNSDVITSASTFDVILTVNQKAVQGCEMMLNCPICISKSGSSHTTMLLATIIGKIISIYQDASKNYFGVTPGPSSQIQPLPLTLGTYRVASKDERWLEIEIVLRELEKLKELFDKFQEVAKASKSEEDTGMCSTVTNYLCQSLQLTFEVLEKQRDISCG